MDFLLLEGLLDLGDTHDENAVDHPGGDTSNVDAGRVLGSAKADVFLKNAGLALSSINNEASHHLFINAGAVNDTGDAKNGVFAVPINTDIGFLGTWEGEMDSVCG